MKTNKTLIASAIIYNAISLFLILTVNLLALIFLAPIFFLITLVILSILWYCGDIQINTHRDKILFLFSTPIPLIAIGFLSFL